MLDFQWPVQTRINGEKMVFKGRDRSKEIENNERSNMLLSESNSLLSRMGALFKDEELVREALSGVLAEQKQNLAEKEARYEAIKNIEVQKLVDEENARKLALTLLDKDSSKLKEIQKAYDARQRLIAEADNLKEKLNEEEKKEAGQKDSAKISELEKQMNAVKQKIAESSKSGEINHMLKELTVDYTGLGKRFTRNIKFDSFGLFLNAAEKENAAKIQEEKGSIKSISEKIALREHGAEEIANMKNELEKLAYVAANPEKAVRELFVKGVNQAREEIKSRPKLKNTEKDDTEELNRLRDDPVFKSAREALDKLGGRISKFEENERLAKKQEKKVSHEMATNLAERAAGRAGRAADRDPSSSVGAQRYEAAKGIIRDILLDGKSHRELGHLIMMVAANGDISRSARSNASKKGYFNYVDAFNAYEEKGADERASKLAALLGPKEKKDDNKGAAAQPGTANSIKAGAQTNSSRINSITQSQADDYANAEWESDAAREKFVSENMKIIKTFSYMDAAFKKLEPGLQNAFISGTLTAQQAVIVYRTLSKAWSARHDDIFTGAAKGYLLSDDSIDRMRIEEIDRSHSRAIYGHVFRLTKDKLDAVDYATIADFVRKHRMNYQYAYLSRTEDKERAEPSPHKPDIKNEKGRSGSEKQDTEAHPHLAIPEISLRRESNSGNNGAGEKRTKKETELLDEGIKEFLDRGVEDPQTIANALNGVLVISGRKLNVTPRIVKNRINIIKNERGEMQTIHALLPENNGNGKAEEE